MTHPYLLIVIFALQVVLLILVALFLIRALVQILSDRTDVPFVRTPERMFAAIASALDMHPSDVVYELGSGDGGFLLWCAERYPDAKFVGFERNPLLVRYARWRAKRVGLSNVEFRKQDLFFADLSGAAKIYAYLLDHVMDRLLPKLAREFHGRLASRAFRFGGKQEKEVIAISEKSGSHGQHLLFIYDF